MVLSKVVDCKNMKPFTIRAQVWVYPGLAGWHFVTLDKTLSTKIREKYKTGFVKIRATIGKSVWNTSLFPHTQSSSYLLCIKNQIRKKEQIFEGDTISVLVSLA